MRYLDDRVTPNTTKQNTFKSYDGIRVIVAIQGRPWAQINGRVQLLSRRIIPSHSSLVRISLNMIA